MIKRRIHFESSLKKRFWWAWVGYLNFPLSIYAGWWMLIEKISARKIIDQIGVTHLISITRYIGISEVRG